MLPLTPKSLLALTLFALAASYILLAFKDTKKELCLVFDRRLIRKYLLRFSIRTVLVWVTLLAFAFSMIGQWELVNGDLPIAFVAVAVGVPCGLLFLIGIQDAFSKKVKRKYRDRL